jgi:hypothetical protein
MGTSNYHNNKGEVPMKTTTSLIIRFISFFSKLKIMEIAILTGFLKRKRNLLPDTVVKVFTFGLLNIPNPSLNVIASKCEEFQEGLRITKNGIYNRLSAAALLLKEIFKQTMAITLKNIIPAKSAEILSQFKDVKIADSTKITLPDKLAVLWPGLGGRNAASALKIQGVFSLISGCFSSIELTKAPGADTTYKNQLLTKIHKEELLIVDLGYFCKEFFSELSAKGAYYLIRIRKNTVVYQEKAGELKELNLPKLLKDGKFLDTQVVIGVRTKQQLKCRLIAIPLPEDIVNQRRRKANKKAKSKGKQLTAYENDLLAYNIVITNVPETMLSAEAACDLYRARWQIELVFKACKSYLNLDKVGQCGKAQLECLLYGRLIAVAFIFSIYNALYLSMHRQYNRGISIMLFVKLWAAHATIIVQNLKLTTRTISLIRKLIDSIAKRSLHDKRRRKTTLEILQDYTVAKDIYQNTA